MGGPEALEDDLVLGLVTGAAGLHQGGGGQRAVVLADGVGQAPVVHVPDVLPLHHHGPQLRLGGEGREGLAMRVNFMSLQNK